MNLTTPALIFPAISLLFLAYNGRFLALASLIRSLHAEYVQHQSPATYAQIENLRTRLNLIRWMELAGVAAFVAAAVAMLLILLGSENGGIGAFGVALGLLLTSLLVSMAEIHISVNALKVHLGEIGRR